MILKLILVVISLFTSEYTERKNLLNKRIEFINLDSLARAIITYDSTYFDYVNTMNKISDYGIYKAYQNTIDSIPLNVIADNHLNDLHEFINLTKLYDSLNRLNKPIKTEFYQKLNFLCKKSYGENFDNHLQTLHTLKIQQKLFYASHPIIKTLNSNELAILFQKLYILSQEHPLLTPSIKLKDYIDSIRVANGYPPYID